jgi:hypothetical protein
MVYVTALSVTPGASCSSAEIRPQLFDEADGAPGAACGD